MEITHETLLELASSGGSIRIDATQVSINQLERLAIIVKNSNGYMTIMQARKLSAETLKSIMNLGGAHVNLDLTA